ncbi:uncharacterized protein LOC123452905 isoform X2 [Hordeum vulgare subsp. vulgare]|uniref:NB-ARC domain-containing protein n=1 Tax=Hordeum vulgare subsp. vulgare TaxID=112509 RepID=A0A287SPZ0_HORVV|nr:uncharacterized protein LOC123452905 isoform X1 [Hordeum vulgare subsp. vulgare]XP_044985576.1 uncharacterized protein LOC123452905 isoform X1 [Hordeum vulgare subsp. vulgare]XP_044985577.1 uncharacterized protein LOC123452905 isoform X2 [Hordeum vulgare subsp. vulgare]
MRTEVIKADTIDEAIEGLLNELNKSRQNVIYFDGWEGLGACAVLRAIARCLELKEPSRPPGLDFEQVIHIDCSKWESTRALQREVAKQLKLSNWVMKMFDKQDEEDDFNGITDQGSRAEIADVAIEIQRSMQGRRFLAVLHNGGNEEIDISRLGLALYPYLTNKVIWTFQGRFRMDPKMKDKVTKNTTDVLLSASCSKCDPRVLWFYLLDKEAAHVACKHGISLTIVVRCFLCLLDLNCIRGHHVDTEYDLTIHTCNYWICDGIIPKIPGCGEEAWQDGENLQGEIRLDMHYHQNDLPPHLLMYNEKRPHWTSPAYGYVLVQDRVVPSGMLQHFDKLSVIKLSSCTFSFSSPPFLCCHSLRFLCLEHCQDLRKTYAEQREEEEDTTRSRACFQSLWVLDLRYTDCDWILSVRVMDLMTQLRELIVMGAKDWHMNHLRGRLRNIQKLRVTKSTCFFNGNLLSEMESIELLDFSGNIVNGGTSSLSGRASNSSLSGPASNSSLKTVFIDGCDGLGKISFGGCKELKNLFLKGLLRGLEELDISYTGVKTLDLGEVRASTLPKRFILVGCEKLRAILWPQGAEKWYGVLFIHQTSALASSNGWEEPHADRSLQQQKEKKFEFGSRISLMDTRLLRSLSAVRICLENSSVHIDIYTAATVGRSSVNLPQAQPHTGITMDSMYIDVLKDGPVTAMMMWGCPEILPGQPLQTCIMKVILHGHGSKTLEDAATSSTTSALSLPEFIFQVVRSLHMYDNSSTTTILAPPKDPAWTNLRWCRVERCPALRTVFNVPQDSDRSSFSLLETFWASQLPSACYIWTIASVGTFSCLTLLHLDRCPRLIHVLPLSTAPGSCLSSPMSPPCLFRLETLEIVYCGDLREVFPLSPELREQDTPILFPQLRRIHLHGLPSLQRICGRRVFAPKIETIKIRGCWSLRRLPGVRINTAKPPKVDCEKDWWDNLEWDGVKENHHPSLYEPSHSLYYKAKVPRDTVLR